MLQLTCTSIAGKRISQSALDVIGCSKDRDWWKFMTTNVRRQGIYKQVSE